ncbi:ABC-type xylose transport system permease subunit [Mycoplasmoides fastidiosum]|uniref:Xylose transport system permease protein XylH n=1 Tax=Mycoplasmoides fastidiosum TaxID=92758 RepID=A0ABU0LY93_9BACT|nr:hypothetical protein [Mycoplasmoides fastidiosum]MDQ0513655.1 ABC-type xylose transport system permease subunit [Mycoplasmoides fastidiosum]UUD37925.1 hypothetical protein NPA10_00820 [Mycoplasmoides fastidiosum]
MNIENTKKFEESTKTSQGFLGRTSTQIINLGNRINLFLTTSQHQFHKSVDRMMRPVREKTAQVFKPVLDWKHQVLDTNPVYLGVTKNLNKYSMFYIGLLILIIFIATTRGDIVRPNIFNNILLGRYTYLFFLGFGMLFVIVSGNIDLSIGSLMGLLATVAGLLLTRSYNPVLTVAIIFLLGIFIGWFQGFLIGYLRIPSFIVTLGGMLLYAGLQKYILNTESDSNSFNIASIESFRNAIENSIPDYTIRGFHLVSIILFIIISVVMVATSLRSRIKKVKYGLLVPKLWVFILTNSLKVLGALIIGLLISFSDAGLRWKTIYLLIGFVLFIFVSTKTVFGRNVFSIGGNRKSAELSGINARKTTTQVFILMGFLTAIAAIMNLANNSSAVGDTGVGEELNTIASVFIGGASAYGGVGTISNTFLGAFILSVIDSGFNILSVNVNLRYVIKGAILVLAVAYDVIFGKRK